jgi:hypothetical protein
VASFNEFVVEAIEEKVRKLTEAEIDAAFAQMADDPDYQSGSVELVQEFAQSDWDALKAGEAKKVAKYESPKSRTSKARTSKTHSR